MSGIKKGKNEIKSFRKDQSNLTISKLSSLIASIRDREKLFEFIFQTLKPELGFDNATIHLWENQGENLYAFNEIKSNVKGNGYFNFEESFSIKETPYEECYKTDKIKLLDFSKQKKEILDLPSFKSFENKKYAEDLILPLFFKNNKIGIIELFGNKKGCLKTLDFELLEAIGTQLAIVISNILIQEENLKRQKEKEILLKISHAMTTITEREDLFQLIMDQIRPIINFQDAVAVEVNPSKTHHRTFLTVSPNVTKENSKYDKVVGQWLPVEGDIVSWTLGQSEDIFLSNTDELLKLYPDSIIANLMKESSLNHSLILKLYSSGILRGFIVFHFAEKPQFNIEKTNVFKEIANQISMALLSILTNETVSRKQKENEILLSIGEAMIGIRDRDVLFGFIMEQIRPIISFQDAAVIEINDETTHYHLFLTMSPESTREHPTYKKVIRNWIPIQGDLIEWMLEQKEDLFVSHIDELLKLYPESSIVNTMKEISLNHSLVFKLYSSGVLKGLIIFSFTDEPKIDLQRTDFYKNIANQVSMALVNIIVNEDILRRQKEKEILLSISEAMLTIRDRKDLFRIMTSRIRPIINFQDATVVEVNPNKTHHRPFLSISPESTREHPNLDKIQGQWLPIEGDVVSWALAKEEEIVIGHTDQLIKIYPKSMALKLMKDASLNHSLILKLYSDGNLKGLIVFHFTDDPKIDLQRTSLYMGVSNHISMAIHNILSNENILEREQIKALRAKLALAITAKSNWPSRFEEIMNSLKEVIPFDFISFVLDTEGDFDKGYAFEKIGFDEYRSISADAFYEQSGKTDVEYKKMRSRRPYKESKIFNGEDFIENIEKDELKKAINRIFQVNSNLNIPLKLNLNGFFQLSFYSKRTNIYNSGHLNLMNQLMEAIIHPLEKVLAYAQIEQLNNQLKQEKDYLQEEIKGNHNFEEIVGNSKGINQVFSKVSQVAHTDSTVLITGETGTGKELIARAIHNLSSREKKPLIKINCAALPAQLLESELFGHEKGAFTGADKQRIGKFELADKGSIFLDEIGELPIELQSKLLRVIQEKEFERLGSNKIIKVDTRIISATNRNLEEEISKGNFRSDLFFRLNVFPIKIPPLRERPEDIPDLAIHFLRKSSKKIGKKITSISSSSLKKLMGYDWPGNVRELEHIIERSILLNKGTALSVNIEKRNMDRDSGEKPKGLFQVKTLEKAEREFILKTLKFCGGKVRGPGGASELLDVNPSTLDSRIKKLGISKVHIFED